MLALRGVSLQLQSFALELDAELACRTTALCGPSGAGKTSVLELVAGLRRPRRGRVELDGELLFDAGSHVDVPPRRRRVGYVPQDLALFPHLTVRGNLLYARPQPAPAMRHRVIEVLEIEALLERAVGTLSGGERRRVALGRALLSAPRLLLLDEPLSGLEARLKERILVYLRRVRDELRTPLLLVSHDPGEVEALCEEALLLERGRLVGRERRRAGA
jgi:molybdate transport system ATP-binding protein